ncbi:acetoacetate--CoA ligase [Geomicrobium sediminis]|uniref:Acetoacetyl-CoA synthetase n=1 Tax=Geomicrobium sediminis TaxID=1347788 RepID=A0ABS2PCH1_9BACL|nr:acetoacetate--CoA ligase [Geomicrobium sediminis]MBM7632806.1 acetoacetyl-CoA synthetase [Geomicrobium sediminis]
MSVQEGTLLHTPSKEAIEQTNLSDYMNWLTKQYGLSFANYHELHNWSVTEHEAFWESLWHYFEVNPEATYQHVMDSSKGFMHTTWFQGANVNYTEYIFRNMNPDHVAVKAYGEKRHKEEIVWGELYARVSAVANGLKALGVERGDRVVSYMPNIPEAMVAMLATASIGAIWSSCSPDFGARTVVDRFIQIEPKVIFAVDGYRYNGKKYDRLDVVKEIKTSIPSLEHVIVVPVFQDALPAEFNLWSTFLSDYRDGSPIPYESVGFDDPLWILYSSGTTGPPKAIVQGHGGIILEHMKSMVLHKDLKSEDVMFWYTSTGWMMWNMVVSGLMMNGTVVLYDGSPAYPDANVTFKLIEEAGITSYGTSAPFIMACRANGMQPKEIADLSTLKAFSSTGATLPPEGSQWVYEAVHDKVWLNSVSGGTDICSAIVGGIPTQPVYAGEIQGRVLGVDVDAWDEEGNSLVDEVGELVIKKPTPSMPLYFWNDPNNERYYESYFNEYKGVWRHGDLIKFKDDGRCQIYGRSDSTINRGGVRMGSSEIYRAVESLEAIKDSLIVDISHPTREPYMPLFVVLEDGFVLSEELKTEIITSIRQNVSPRHVPNEIYVIEEVPRTLNGKKVEVPVKKLLMGVEYEQAVNEGSLQNPHTFNYFKQFHRQDA